MLVVELMEGGQLLDMLRKREENDERLQERGLAQILYQVLKKSE